MTPVDRTGIEILPLDDCKRMLEASRIGRVAFLYQGTVAILPVNYRWHHGAVVFRSAEGAKLDAASGEQLVGFEIDAWDDELHTGWSVLVEGRAEEVYDDIEVAELETLGVRPWAPHPRRNRWVRIVAEEITGRRVG
ncbi:MAG: pyridoxamine 5'-phosphate oxidase family protein [Acidimicrobiales bacterium]|nr:pyridoxamine 5'-phosphate oxidase family protein [Acidimicrobiales bacterium]